MNEHRSTRRYVFIAVSLPHLAESEQHACAPITEQGEVTYQGSLSCCWTGPVYMGEKRGHVFEGVYTHIKKKMSQQCSYLGQWGREWGMNPFLMLLMDHHVSCFNGRLHV